MSTTLLISNNIFDGISEKPFAGGILVTDDKISGVLKGDETAPYLCSADEVKDYGDKLIMPGFIDSHIHVGFSMDYLDDTFCVDVAPARNERDMMALLASFHAAHPERGIIFAYNFNYFELETPFTPDAALLDSYFPDTPVAIVTWDGHTWFCNSSMTALAGITKDTEDPNNGMMKDKNGELTGIFNDTATYPFARLTERPLMERRKTFLHFTSELNKYGITSVGDVFPYGNEEPYPLYKAVEDDGALTVRFSVYPPLLDATEESTAFYQKTYNSSMLQFGGLKCLLDGVITVHTAWMLEPYADAPETMGFPSVDIQKVREKVLDCQSKGISVRIHAIGDASVRYVLDVYEEAEKTYGRIDRHHVMEHLEYISDSDIPRLGKLNVIAAMQGRHITFYVDDAKKIMGADRERLAFRWRDVLDAGGTIGTGSDYSVVHFSPFRCIYAATTRRLENGHPKDGWLPEQCVTLAEALKSYTYGSACALNREHELGTLEVGKLADIVVIDRNLFDIPAEEILDAMPEMTMVGGKVVYTK